ncbi:MAG: isocitrate lyase/phosphoenolpyruvate mutase family protein [Chthoniobacterales bacterium]|nr:isocitrate lyase/phosphoenolpyruvate mutase family protein [Chthoniobacterales bacterium]
MQNAGSAQLGALERFWTLHESGCFVLPNPWDMGTALYLQHLGFEALATTSAGFAFTRGRPDGAVPRDEMLGHIREIVAATTIPVNADFLAGFSDDPAGVAANVALCIATGVAGLSIEDSTGRSEEPLFAQELAVDRVKAAREAIDAFGVPVVLTGRCEAFLVRHAEPMRVVLARLVAYAEAGADCLYAPGVSEPDDIAAIVGAVAPKPVNVLVSGFNSHLNVSQLADLGVRRISVGSGLALAAWGAFIRAADEIVTDGKFQSLSDGAPFADLNARFASNT